MVGKLLSGIMSMYVDSLDCVKIKVDESEWFRIDSGVRQGVSCLLGSDEGGENGDGKEGSEISGEGKRVKIAWSLVCR